jgi:kumamolisin
MIRYLGCALTVGVLGCSGSPAALGPHQTPRLRGAVDIGPVSPSEPIDLVMVMKPRGDVPALIAQQLRPTSPWFGRYLTPAEFGDQFGPTDGEYDQLLAWLESRGLAVARREPSRTSVTVSGTADAVEQALNTRLRNYRDARGEFRAPAVEPQFSPTLANLIEGVIGLDDAARFHSHMHAPEPQPNASGGGSQDPADLQKLYGADAAGAMGFHGEGETIAILGTGYPPSTTKDIDPFITKFKLTFNRKAQLTQWFLGGPNRNPDSEAQTEYGENILDIDMVMGMAPAASVVHVFTATNSPGLFGDGIPFILNQVPQAHAVSVSYGICERFAIGEAMTLNYLFAQAKAQGQTWFIASGDDGTDGCKDTDPNGVFSVDWPSASPFVLGVGGTALSSGKEVAWDSGGGGQSEFEVKPAYQIGVGPYANDKVRDVPDVAALAGPPGVTIGYNGQTSSSEGTSCAAPIWAGAWAILDQSQGGGGVRNSHERIYQLAGVGFHDITGGANNGGATEGFQAIPGYDLATGWGSPDLPNLIKNWK